MQSTVTLPPDVRYSMLREIGYSTKEIFDAIRSVGKAKVRRRISIQRQKYEPVIEFVECEDGHQWFTHHAVQSPF